MFLASSHLTCALERRHSQAHRRTERGREKAVYMFSLSPLLLLRSVYMWMACVLSLCTEDVLEWPLTFTSLEPTVAIIIQLNSISWVSSDLYHYTLNSTASRLSRRQRCSHALASAAWDAINGHTQEDASRPHWREREKNCHCCWNNSLLYGDLCWGGAVRSK